MYKYEKFNDKRQDTIGKKRLDPLYICISAYLNTNCFLLLIFYLEVKVTNKS